MLVESTAVHGFQVLRIKDDLSVNSDISEIKPIVHEYLQQGITKIALAFSRDSYLYTRSIAVLVQCLEMINERKGVLAIFQPNEDILDMLAAISFDTRVLIALSENDLAVKSEAFAHSYNDATKASD